jgi:TonB family protein
MLRATVLTLATAVAPHAALAQTDAASPPAASDGVPPAATTPAGGTPGAEAPAQAPADLVPPELTGFVQAEYPAEAEAAGATGEVMLRLTIDADGKVSEAVVESPAAGPFGPRFDQSALDAVKLFTFTPARVQDQPVAVQILYRYAFTLESTVEVKPAPGDLGIVHGELLERGTRAPLSGFLVRLPGLQREAVTDDKGRFSFDQVPAGPVKILVEDPAFVALEDEEDVKAGEAVDVRYYLERVDSGDEMVVVGRRPAKEVARRTLTVEEIRKIPGTQGDALKVIQNLPGVARVPFGGGGLLLRGADQEDSGAFLNRHWVPQLFHFGGLRSTFSSALLESIDLYPGNFGAEYGGLAGGLVEARVRRPRDDGFHGFVEADVFDAGFLLEGPATENATFAIAARRSYVDALLPLVLSDDENAFTVAPRYYDYQAVYDWKKGAHRLRALAYGSSDALELLLEEPADDPAFRGGFENDVAYYNLFLAWNYEPSAAFENELSVTAGRQLSRQALGDRFLLDFKVWQVNYRDDVSVKLSDALRLRGGLDGYAYVADAEVKAPNPPKEGENQQPLGTQETLYVKSTVEGVAPSLWTELDVKLGDLLVVPGVRADYFSPIQGFAVDPRMTARYTLAPGSVAKAGVGQYSSPPEVDEYNDTFGNPDLDMQHTLQYSAGFEQQLTDAISVDVVGFYRDMRDRVVSVDDPEVKYTNDGQARAYGAEVLLRHDLTDKFFGWLSYTLMRSERKDGPDEDWRLADSDQTHILTVLGQYKFNKRWELGVRWRYVTGNLETPITGGVFDSDADVYAPIYGKTNSRRQPAFHQLDVRLDKHWIFDTWVLTAYLDVQNAYNRENPEATRYNYDYTESDTVNGLPLIPSFGLRGEF